MQTKRPAVFYHLQGYGEKEKEPFWKLVIERR